MTSPAARAEMIAVNAVAQSGSLQRAIRCSARQPSLWGVDSGATSARHFCTSYVVMVTAVVSRVGTILGPYMRRKVSSRITPGALKRSGIASRVSWVASAIPLLSSSPAALGTGYGDVVLSPA